MNPLAEPWRLPGAGDTGLRLEALPPRVLHALAATAPGDEAAAGANGVTGRISGPGMRALDAVRREHPILTPWLVGPESRGLWVRRSRQILETPQDAPWISRLIVDPALREAVGIAGFHGAPDAEGMVEVGYRVDPARRRQGYARRSLEILLDVAAREPEVRTVRASIAPDNAASLALAMSCGFVQLGEQWDEEDGLELVLEVSA